MIPRLDPVKQRQIFEANQTLKQIKRQMQKTRQAELFFKAFLKPIQITLKTGSTEGDREKLRALPYGLKQVVKASIDENKYALLDFQSVDETFIRRSCLDPDDDQIIFGRQQKKEKGQLLEDFRNGHCDNLISLMKSCRKDFRLKVAICVCVYNQSKAMLKQTLDSINKNIEAFIKNGVSYNDIGVFVFIDGIETIHPTVQQYFQDLQNECNIFLADDAESASLERMRGQDEDLQSNNFNHLIFSDEEFQDFKKRRFSARKKQYKELKDMIKEINQLEKQTSWNYETLNVTIKRFFAEQARVQFKWEKGLTEDELHKINEKQIVEYYTDSVRKCTPIIRIALQNTKKYLKQYMASRDNLALLNTFRVPIKMSTKTLDRKFDAKMNLFLVTKYKNRGKLSSHNWFFNGFCQELKPQFAFLLDVGLVCDEKALWKMYSYMEDNKGVGGVCGYMKVRYEKTLDEEREDNFPSLNCVSKCLLNFFNIQRAQQFQYHYAHLINKPFESCFGFIHVLPGAFSGYRMAALRKQDYNQDSQLLIHYFSSIQNPEQDVSYYKYHYTPMQTFWKIFIPDWLDCIYNCIYEKPPEDSYEKLLYDKNIYLAEDRILCMGLHQNGYSLAYLPDAQAHVDPVKNIRDFLGQRRRWMNGSYFAFQKVKNQALQGGEASINLQIFYLSLLDMITYFSLSIFFYTNHLTMKTLLSDAIVPILYQLGVVVSPIQTTSYNILDLFVPIMDFIYVIVILLTLIYGLMQNNRNKGLKLVYYATAVFYGILSYLFLGVLTYSIITFKQGAFTSSVKCIINKSPFQIVLELQNLENIKYLIVSFVGLYILPLLCYTIFKKGLHIVQVIASFPSFIFYSQTYLNTLTIYSLCKIDDISWGTKGLDKDPDIKQQDMLEDWRNIKIIHVCKYILYNILAGTIFYFFQQKDVLCLDLKKVMIIGLPLIIGFTFLFRIVMGMVYMIIYRLSTKMAKNPIQKISKKKRVQIQRSQSPKKGLNINDQTFSVEQLPPPEPVSQQVQIPDLITQRFNKLKQNFYEQIRRKILQLQKQIKQTKKSAQVSVPLYNVAHSRILYKQKLTSKIVRQGRVKPKTFDMRSCISKINLQGYEKFARQDNRNNQNRIRMGQR